VNVDERDEDGATALDWAASNGNVEAIKALLELGADKDAKTANGATALHLAADHGHVEAIKVLAELGADKRRRMCMERRRFTWRQTTGMWRRSRCWRSSACR
jgi:ankyrin repeat protein